MISGEQNGTRVTLESAGMIEAGGSPPLGTQPSISAAQDLSKASAASQFPGQ
jgi:hypothetical protein